METKTISATMTELQAHAETIKNAEPSAESLEVGDVLRQGDLYVARLRDGVDLGGRVHPGRQLADGTTQGSRHVLTGDCALRQPDAAKALAALADLGYTDVRAYQVGPWWAQAGPETITHPEHGHRTLTEPGVYIACFQRSVDTEAREVRAAD